MKGSHILSSLCYLSVFFAPFLLPIIVYFVGDHAVKVHAKKALWTHLIPYVTLVIGLVVSGTIGLNQGTETAVGFSIIATYAITAIVMIYYFIWNIVKGVKVLNEM